MVIALKGVGEELNLSRVIQIQDLKFCRDTSLQTQYDLQLSLFSGSLALVKNQRKELLPRV